VAQAAGAAGFQFGFIFTRNGCLSCYKEKLDENLLIVAGRSSPAIYFRGGKLVNSNPFEKAGFTKGG
jgi:hypothetical protein